MSNARNSSADRLAASKAVSMLLVHHKLKVPAPIRRAMEALHMSATRAERRRKNAKSDAERLRDRLAQSALLGKATPSANELAKSTGIEAKSVHAHLAMMRKRIKR